MISVDDQVGERADGAGERVAGRGRSPVCSVDAGSEPSGRLTVARLLVTGARRE
jgi:hypothetical protein